MKMKQVDGVPTIVLDTGIEIEIHGLDESLSICAGGYTFDLTIHDGRLVCNGTDLWLAIETTNEKFG